MCDCTETYVSMELYEVSMITTFTACHMHCCHCCRWFPLLPAEARVMCGDVKCKRAASLTSASSYSKSSETPTWQVTWQPLSKAGSKSSGIVSCTSRVSPTFMPTIASATPRCTAARCSSQNQCIESELGVEAAKQEPNDCRVQCSIQMRLFNSRPQVMSGKV